MLAARFIRLSVIYAILGMAIGIYMAASMDHSQMPTHAHLNLLGFVSMFLFGIFYKLYPQATEGKLPVVHFWISNVGMIGLVIGVSIIYSGNMELGERLASVFSIIVILSMALFTKIVFSATRQN
ncbi:MAG: cytochrome-c oxidase [Rhodospirillales bacterium]|nr:cytochrome-c oxidase [Rhodospirillales bacterium]